MLDTKVCNSDWLPESLPLSDPRKADATVRNFLNMASGVGPEAVPAKKPFETALGHVEGSPFAKLKGDPGTVFNYSNAGVSHLVLVFHKATGHRSLPLPEGEALRTRRDQADPLANRRRRWRDRPVQPGIQRDLHRPPRTRPVLPARPAQGRVGRQADRPRELLRLRLEGYARSTPPTAAQWWVYPRWKEARTDLVMTSGRNHNDGFVLPSKDLIFVRLGEGGTYPRDFEDQLVKRVLAARMRRTSSAYPAKGGCTIQSPRWVYALPSLPIRPSQATSHF